MTEKDIQQLDDYLGSTPMPADFDQFWAAVWQWLPLRCCPVRFTVPVCIPCPPISGECVWTKKIPISTSWTMWMR